MANESTQNYQLIDPRQYQQMMADLKKSAGQPTRPGWESMLDESGLLKAPYQVEDQYNRGALKQMRSDALRAPGEQSPWRKLMESQVGAASAGAQAQTGAAMNQLAMRGGLRSGAAERMAQSGAQNALQAGQNARMQLNLQDEQMRQAGLGQLNQAELQAAQQGQGVQQGNINAALNDITQKRYADLEAYKEQLRAWGSEKAAAAAPSGGGGKK